jgi:hypothetical protein
MPILAACRTTIVVAILAATAGCAQEVAQLRQRLAHPGPTAYQRAAAIQHDPYLLDDVGPEVVGARPREYQRPLNEVQRARLAATPPLGMQTPPPAGVIVAPPPPAYPAAPAAQPAPFPAQQRPPY